ncbi:HalOD1 output domain-containing protein [Haloarcula laminariae]|uniref:HalOD1 output domain-containing protein n=1 Tax=Haloarcula laminariae TaxID=2961577 RepID=UPI0021C98680|nr:MULTISPECIES: HalOD1 output domain-containing protein [Halomicroarcula]
MNCSGGRTDEAPLVRRTRESDARTLAVVRAVAAAKNESPQSLAPLGNVVDPDALETVVDESDGATHVTFSYAGHRVVVSGEAVEVY